MAIKYTLLVLFTCFYTFCTGVVFAQGSSINYYRAIDEYTSAIHLNPDNAKLYVLRGRMYKEVEEYSETVKDFELARKIDLSSCSDEELAEAHQLYINQLNHIETRRAQKPQYEDEKNSELSTESSNFDFLWAALRTILLVCVCSIVLKIPFRKR